MSLRAPRRAVFGSPTSGDPVTPEKQIKIVDQSSDEAEEGKAISRGPSFSRPAKLHRAGL
jgi:hypothetical protein